MMTHRCVIISGGSYSPIEGVKEQEFVIACDKGYAYAKQAGIRPNLLVGDFDSYGGDLPSDLPVWRYKKEKDDTDTMIAVRYAVEQGVEQVDLFCALGGRLDHLYANLQAAAFAVANGGCRVTIHDRDTMLYFLSEGSITLLRQEGFSLSVFAVSDTCEDVCIEGGKYHLNHAVVTNTFPIGMSNQWAAEEAKISVGKGILMVMLARVQA